MFNHTALFYHYFVFINYLTFRSNNFVILLFMAKSNLLIQELFEWFLEKVLWFKQWPAYLRTTLHFAKRKSKQIGHFNMTTFLTQEASYLIRQKHFTSGFICIYREKSLLSYTTKFNMLRYKPFVNIFWAWH